MTQYYVDDAVGSDSNDGLNPGAGNAWLTIGRGTYTQPIYGGDILNIYPGTYTGVNHWAANGAQQGEADAHILYRGVGSGVIVDASPLSGPVWSVGMAYIDMENMEFEWANTASHVVEIISNGGSGFYDCTMDGETLTGDCAVVYVKDSNFINLTGNRVKANSSNASGRAVEFEVTSTGRLYGIVSLLRNEITGLYLHFTGNGPESGWFEVTLDSNLIHDTGGSGTILRNIAGGYIYNNAIYVNATGGGGYPLNFPAPSTAYRPCTNINIVNNTLINKKNGSIYSGSPQNEFHDCFNNVVFCETTSLAVQNIPTIRFDYWYDVNTSGSNFRMGTEKTQGEIDAFLAGFENVTYNKGTDTLTVTDLHTAYGGLWHNKGKTSWSGQSAPQLDFEGDVRY